MSRDLALLTGLSLSVFTSELTATTVVAPDFATLVGEADYVVRVVIQSVRAERRPSPAHPGRQFIASRVAVEIKEVIKGRPPEPLVLEMLGGRVDDEHLVVQGAPQFAPGEEHILFIRGNGRVFSPFVALRHGCYPVQRDVQTGTDRVLRANGRPLYHEREVVESLELDASALRLPAARPLSVAEFSARIRSVAAHLTADVTAR